MDALPTIVEPPTFTESGAVHSLSPETWRERRQQLQALGASNRRYLEFISALDLPGVGIRAVEKVARPARERGRPYPGFNLFHGDDLDLFLTIARGEFAISGLRNRPAHGRGLPDRQRGD